MRRRVFLRPEAERDLEGQAEYIAHERDAETGLRFFRAVEDTLEVIASQPRMGSARRFTRQALAAIRMLPVKDFEKYLIFYRPLEGAIEVVRILHGARDVEDVLEQ